MKLKQVHGLSCWHIVTDRGVLVEQHANKELAHRRFEKLNQNAERTIEVSQTQIVDAIKDRMSNAEENPEPASEETPEIIEPDQQAEDVLDQSAGHLVREIKNGAFDSDLVDLLAREEQGAARKTVIAAIEGRQAE
tara:strand:- start:426 stop:833 length:408 start_codon:yes stop_codon:yes gene_type:complete